MHHPKVNQQENDYIREGGGATRWEIKKSHRRLPLRHKKRLRQPHDDWRLHRQFCVTSITWFLLTWFSKPICIRLRNVDP